MDALWFFALVFVLALSACSAPSELDEVPQLVCSHSSKTGEILPLELGNFWVYDVKNSLGEVIDTLRIEIISELKSSDNRRHFVMRNQRSSNPNLSATSIWTTDNDDALMVGYISISTADTVWAEVVRLPADTQMGQTFFWYYWDRSELSGLLEKYDSTQYLTSSIASQVWVGGISHTAITFEYPLWIVSDANPDDMSLKYVRGIGLVEVEQRRFRTQPPIPPRQLQTLQEWCVMAPE